VRQHIAYRANQKIKLLQREIPNLIPPDFWPPNSPDLIPVDCRIWGMMPARMHQTPVRDVTDLRLR